MRNQFAFVLLLVGIVLLIIILEFRDLKRKNRHAEDDAREQKRSPKPAFNDTPPHGIGIIAEDFIEFYKSDSKHKTDQDKKNYRIQRLTVYGVTIYTFLTGLILAITAIQNYLSDRPFVSIEKIELSPVQTGIPPTSWSIETTFTNSGSTPTNEMKISLNWLSVPGGIPSGFSRCNFNGLVQTRIPIGAKESTSISMQNIPTSVIDVSRNTPSTKFLIWGRINYGDSIIPWIRIPHETRFCWDVTHVNGDITDWKSALAVRHALCLEGNCIDGECKSEDEEKYQIPAACIFQFIPKVSPPQ